MQTYCCTTTDALWRKTDCSQKTPGYAPPSRSRFWPVIYPAWVQHRKAHAAPNSSIRPNRARGIPRSWLAETSLTPRLAAYTIAVFPFSPRFTLASFLSENCQAIPTFHLPAKRRTTPVRFSPPQPRETASPNTCRAAAIVGAAAADPAAASM